MAKTLRVCLAMGGGVSLGSFSGSSLTEALKLLILYGQDEDGNPYDDVIVDGMSGASAGAIALTIMLKCLIDYQSMMPLYDSKLSVSDLLQELAEDYFDGNTALVEKHAKKEELLALQLSQKIQKKIWVNEVNSKKLFGNKIKKDFKADQNAGFALLDRALLEKLTKLYLMNDSGVDSSRKKVLANDRVVFACSLTNLLPIEVLSKYEGLGQLDKNVLKSVGSKNHSELRVIDFVFDEEKIKTKPTDERWLKFTATPDPEIKTQFNLSDRTAWSTISASALACGAFPIAFEPVILKRFSNEFGGAETESEWPRSFRIIQAEMERAKNEQPEKFKENAFIGNDILEPLDYNHFNFAYMDGGTFNNEPIREAFKIGTFQDYNRVLSNEDRLILFVDPIVRQEDHPSFKLKGITPIKIDGKTVALQNELGKLSSSVASIIGVLTNQGSVKEEHKINDLKENLKLRNSIFPYLDKNPDLGENLTLDLIATAFNKIRKNLRNGIISLGTRDPLQYFINELRKSCDQKGASSNCLLITKKQLAEIKIGVNTQKTKTIKDAYEHLNIITKSDKNIFAQTVFKTIIDFALNTDGKNENAKRAAILPINEKLNTIKLPGEEIEAFGGFASLKAKEYAFEFGRLSTVLSLREDVQGFRKKHPFIASAKLKKLESNITKGINDIAFFEKHSSYENDLKTNLFELSVIRVKNIVLSNAFLSYLLSKVPFIVTGFFSAPVLLWKSLFNKLPWKGNSILSKLVDSASQSINYLSLEPIIISILSDQNLKERLLIECSDTKLNSRVAKRTEVIYNGKKRYQYFFQVYKLLYPEINAKIAPTELSASNTALKMESGHVGAIKLSLSPKIRLPNHIDGNLYPEEKFEALIENYDNLIDGIRLDHVNFPPITLAINDAHSALHFCLKNSHAHMNPMLEIDVNELKKGWYFKEQTESLTSKLLK